MIHCATFGSYNGSYNVTNYYCGKPVCIKVFWWGTICSHHPFLASVILVLFLLVHMMMVIQSGFKKMRFNAFYLC